MAVRLIDSRRLPSLGAVLRVFTGMLIGITLAAPRAFATTAGAPMPWDGPLNLLVANITGPTARALVLIAVVACGLLWAFTRNEEGLKRLGQIAFGGAIALGAVTLMASLGIAGAAV
jgi:type IV secretory pathway VirB2 component (pilin)